MTKQQILAEIAAKIDGQGSAIDAGSALPGILRGILDLIPAEQVNSDWNATEGPAEILNKPTIPAGIKDINLASWNLQKISLVSKSEFATALGCSEAEVDKLFADNVGQLKISIGTESRDALLKVVGDYNGNSAVFGISLGNVIAEGAYFSRDNDDNYSAIWYEL